MLKLTDSLDCDAVLLGPVRRARADSYPCPGFTLPHRRVRAICVTECIVGSDPRGARILPTLTYRLVGFEVPCSSPQLSSIFAQLARCFESTGRQRTTANRTSARAVPTLEQQWLKKWHMITG